MPTLEITIHGLCLFVPYDNAMYVLMPQTGDDVNGGKVVKHESKLHIDKGPVILLDGFQLDILSGSGTGADPNFPCGVVDISGFSTLKVPKESLEQNLDNKVNARVVLKDGGMDDPKTVACWFLPGSGATAEMTDTVVWRMPVNTTRIVLKLSNLDGRTGPETLVTLPENSGTTKIMISHHVKGSDTTFGHRPHEPPPHFAGFYYLLEKQFNPLPGYDPTGNCGCPGATVAKLGLGIVPPTSTIYTCMVAGAQPLP